MRQRGWAVTAGARGERPRSPLVETRRCETGWRAALKGELVTAGLSAPLCQVRGDDDGQDFTPKQCFVNNVHKADALYPAPRLQKNPKPMELSCPAGTFAQRSLRGVKWVPVWEQCLVRGPPGPLSSRHPVLSHLRISACPGNVLAQAHPLPGFKCLLGIKGFS